MTTECSCGESLEYPALVINPVNYSEEVEQVDGKVYEDVLETGVSPVCPSCFQEIEVGEGIDSIVGREYMDVDEIQSANENTNTFLGKGELNGLE